MVEIKREPIKVTVDNEPYVAFDDNHTLSDIISYAASQAGKDGLAEIIGIAQGMQNVS